MSSTNERERFETFPCDSQYMDCEECGVRFPYREEIKATPPTDEPLEGWASKRCYPDCTQAAKDRLERKLEPVPAGGVPPSTETFRTKFSYNRCIRCKTSIELGAWVTATRDDVPYGQYLRRWRDFYHAHGCPPPASPTSLR